MKRLSLFFLVFFAHSAWTADAVFNQSGVAVNGYDVVAYHVEAEAIKGESSYSHNWNNVDWYFSNKANRDAFVISPERYAPQYGGFCAYAASKGSLAPTDPHAWTVYRDKLYLNYSSSVKDIWKRNIDKYIEQADLNWKWLKNKK